MIISTKQSVIASCSNEHRQSLSARSIDMLTGSVYADMFWINAPEQGSPG